jgi:ketosteroid isomerase-like protein
MKILILLSLSLMLTAAVSAQSEVRKSKIASEIRKVMDDQSEAWNRGDIDRFMQGYWRSEKLIFVSGDSVTRGWQPTLERYKKSYNSREKMGTLTFSGLETTVLSNDAAVVLGNWELKRKEDNPKGKFTLTFRKLREGWRIIMDHTS